MTRREFAAGLTPAVRTRRRSALRVESMRVGYEDYSYRTPMKWGGVVIHEATILNVHCTATVNTGRTIHGFGSMKMGNTWAFRTERLTYHQTLDLMKKLALRIGALTESCREFAHPIELNRMLAPLFQQAAAALGREEKLPEPVPELFTLVTACAFDAATHDAYGKANGLNCYRTYGADHLPYDLSRYLGPEFQGEYPDRYVLPRPVSSLPLYHLVGAADALTAAGLNRRANDGLPETLEEWIRREQLTHFKIKLLGTSADADVDRTIAVYRVAQETSKTGILRLSLDFNEMCPNVDYLIGVFRRIREKSPAAFDAIQYVEQPTSRDLRADRANTMHRAVRFKPVVIDESLTGYETFLLAREMGYSGVALKACKGQSESVLMAAAAQKFRMFRCVQDLTCPGASLVHSAGLAAHIPGVAAIEANARQFCPAANAAWVEKFPGLFRVRGGALRTGDLDKPGLSATAG
jgi:L-alanine-DL-glutamate epimerase-like enolase superfamily enzyme